MLGLNNKGALRPDVRSALTEPTSLTLTTPPPLLARLKFLVYTMATETVIHNGLSRLEILSAEDFETASIRSAAPSYSEALLSPILDAMVGRANKEIFSSVRSAFISLNDTYQRKCTRVHTAGAARLAAGIAAAVHVHAEPIPNANSHDLNICAGSGLTTDTLSAPP